MLAQRVGAANAHVHIAAVTIWPPPSRRRDYDAQAVRLKPRGGIYDASEPYTVRVAHRIHSAACTLSAPQQRGVLRMRAKLPLLHTQLQPTCHESEVRRGVNTLCCRCAKRRCETW